MNRLVVKLTSVDESMEYIVIQDIQRMKDVKESKVDKATVPAHTAVYLIGKDTPVLVTEPSALIMQLAGQHSNSLGWVKQ